MYIDAYTSSDIIAQMGGERPKWISNLIDIFKKPSQAELLPSENETRFVKNTEITLEQNGEVSVDELSVELLPDEPDDFARVIAHTFRTGKTTFGTYDKKTGKFTIESSDSPDTD